MFTDWTGAILPGETVDGRPPPSGAAGVNVAARRIFNTHLIRLAGITSWTVIQEATAIAGPTTGCPETIEGCVLLPIAFPVTVLACGQGNTSVPELPTRSWPPGVEVTIPLCGGNPGSVGWIDWSPPGGGTPELEDAILQPTAYYIPLPSWHYITETGDVSAAYIEDALNEYAGDTVLFPLFDSTCSEEPTNNQSSGCDPEFVGGSGVNQWYHISAILSFRLNEPKGRVRQRQQRDGVRRRQRQRVHQGLVRRPDHRGLGRAALSARRVSSRHRFLGPAREVGPRRTPVLTFDGRQPRYSCCRASTNRPLQWSAQACG